MPSRERWVTATIVLLALQLAVIVGGRLLDPNDDTTLFHTVQFARARQGADSWKPMELARAAAADRRDGLYTRVFFQQGVKFQYPPSALLLSDGAGRRALNVVSWFATLATMLLSAGIFARSLDRLDDGRDDAAVRRTSAVLGALALSGLYYPLMKAYSLGQVQAWLACLFSLVLALWTSRLPATAVWTWSGVAVGLMCLVKPTYGLLLVWGAARSLWRFCAAGATVVAVVSAVAAWEYGAGNYLDYARVLSYISHRGESFYANQSINGLLNRLLFNGPNLEWEYHAFAPPRPDVFAVTVLAFVVLFAAAVWPTPGSMAGSAVDLSIAMTTVTVTAPIAWEHHYSLLLPVFAAVAMPVVRARAAGRATSGVLIVSYLLCSSFLPFTNRFAGSRLNVLQSYVLAGALLLLGLMHMTNRARADR